MRSAIIISMTAFGSLSACNPSRQSVEPGTAALFNTHWKLLAFGQEPVGPSNKEPFMKLQELDNKVAGSGGCNSFFGSFSLSGPSQIKFSAIGSTKMACPDMEVETRFFQVLEQTSSYSFNGDSLYLKDGAAMLAKLVAVK